MELQLRGTLNGINVNSAINVNLTSDEFSIGRSESKKLLYFTKIYK